MKARNMFWEGLPVETATFQREKGTESFLILPHPPAPTLQFSLLTIHHCTLGQSDIGNKKWFDIQFISDFIIIQQAAHMRNDIDEYGHRHARHGYQYNLLSWMMDKKSLLICFDSSSSSTQYHTQRTREAVCSKLYCITWYSPVIACCNTFDGWFEAWVSDNAQCAN